MTSIEDAINNLTTQITAAVIAITGVLGIRYVSMV